MVLEEMDLSALMEEVAARMGPELEKVGCRLTLKLQSPLRVESVQGQGSSFTVELPLRVED